jgi:hypothetical protein
MAKMENHDFVLPSNPRQNPLGDEEPESFDIRATSKYQSLDTEMDFLGGDSGTQNKNGEIQPRKLKFLYK